MTADNRMMHTLDARNNLLLEVVGGDLSPSRMNGEILEALDELRRLLSAKGVDYGRLRRALTPTPGRREVALVFDANATGEGWYGFPIAREVLRRLPRKNFACSILDGDLILGDELQDVGFDILANSLVLHRPVREFSHTHELYAVYVTNLSDTQERTLTETLQDYEPYLGHIDATYSSRAKDWLSTTLVHAYVKAGTVFIGEHEDDAEDGNYNLLAWPFDEVDCSVVSVPSWLYGLFLSYKIERRSLPGESDVRYSLTALSGEPPRTRLSDLRLDIPPAKFEYIRTHHDTRKLGSVGLQDLRLEDFVAEVRSRLDSNYLYSLLLKHHPKGVSLLFNLNLEFPPRDTASSIVQVQATFEYFPADGVIRLVTLY